MAKLIIHNGNETPGSIAERRLMENTLLTPHERFKKTFELMALAALFKKGPIKTPQGLGVVLKRKVLIEEKIKSGRPKDLNDVEELKKAAKRNNSPN